ncbi:MAG: S-methyl-5-thioribose-1-phosphate isomerase [Candidatus Micrarchaeota archaeon]
MANLQPSVKKTIADIKSLRIQGARNIAKEAIKALVIEAKSSKAKTISEFEKHLTFAAENISSSRPTEPMMRNSIEMILNDLQTQVNSKGIKKVDDAKKLVTKKGQEILDRFEIDIRKLVEYGAKLIPDGATVMTHCHSSTTTKIFKHAKDLKKEFNVISCETRPRFQGRITAKELSDYGIKTTQIVDGAANLFMKKADMVIVGADAITSRGDLINKIGTSMIAHLAKMHDISFYSAAETYKYSPKTFFGQREEVEERDTKEVWDKAPKSKYLIIRNPAFEVTANEYIRAYITESGIIPPQLFFAIASNKLGIKIYE